jgi:apolipoprotein N-acyltransferase
MVNVSRSGWRSLAGLVLSAALLSLYSRGGLGYLLGFVALVPWLLTLNATPSAATSARSGLWMSFAFVAAVFAWFGAAIGAYTGIGSATGLFVVLIAAPLLQPQIVAFALVRHFAGRRYGPIIRALAGATAWVATEWLVPKLLGDTIGHGLYPSQTLRQVADLGGAAGLTFLLIIVNECVALAITHRRRGARVFAKPLAMAASLIILMSSYGVVRLSDLTSTSNSGEKPLRIGVVQSNIVDYERLRREMGAYEVVRHVLDTHYAMSREAIEQHQVDALLWSETVYPTTFANPKSEGGAELDKEILDFVTAVKVPLVFGTYDLDDQGEYNAAAFVEPVAGTLGFYRKTDLFFLTEYLPEWLDGPAARRLLPWAGSWKPGSGARVFPLRLADGREIPVLPMICLDDVDTNLGIDGARLGAQVILSLSNDSWFTQYPVGANLHLTVAAFRSIETRLPQMRVTNNGVSAVIDASGAIIASTAMDEQKLLIGEVAPTEASMTLMLAWGNWVGRAGFVFLVLLALFSAAAALKRRTERNSTLASNTIQVPQNFRANAYVLTPVWRVSAGLLRVLACGGLLWIAKAIVFGDGNEINTLTQIWMFAALVLAPEAAAWSIMRAFRATIYIENNVLILEQRERRIEISVKDIAALESWKLPLPIMGVSLKLQSGKRWSHGIALNDATGLVQALISAGGSASIAESLSGFASVYSSVSHTVARWRIDHFVFKFVLFPLVPALPAFRLHQVIAYGGTFGEYQTFGLKAYLIALAIWWASWAMGMMLFAAALRAIIEFSTLLSITLLPKRAIEIRSLLELLGRMFFFVGVPAWLLIKIWP